MKIKIFIIQIFILILIINFKQTEEQNLFFEDSKINQITNLSEFVFPKRNSASESEIQESLKRFIQAIKIYPDPKYYFELGNALIKKYNTNLNEKERMLIGIWQDSPVMASGWTNTLNFFPDRTLIQRYNTMDCAKREISKTGNWKLIQNQLIIQFYKKEHILGGKFVYASGSCGTEKELVNGKIIESKIKPVQISKKIISEIKKDDIFEIGREDYNLTIDEIRYWKLRNNPEDYE